MSLVCPSIIEDQYPKLCKAIDLYCERTSPDLDAELVNAITNLAFPIAAYFAWRLYRNDPNPDDRRLIGALIGVTVLIGVGSFVLHTFATAWAQWGDVIPILIFMLLYLWFVLTRYFGWAAWAGLSALSGFLGATLYLEAVAPARFLWGGAMYLPALLTFIVIGGAMYHRRLEAGQAMLGAAGIFMLSFAIRTVDMPMCHVLPMGTHFLWHLLNALLLYWLIRLAILHALPRARARHARRWY